MNLKESSLAAAVVSKLGAFGIREVEQLPYFLRETSALHKLAVALNMNPAGLRELLTGIVVSHPEVEHPPVGSERFSARGLRVPERRKAGIGY